jgi:hypothetical protein
MQMPAPEDVALVITPIGSSSGGTAFSPVATQKEKPL